MHHVVIGVDGPAFGSGAGEVDEAHQAYMDGWLPKLVARGPTLSPDGRRHTGSVHVLDLSDGAAAARFADEEPYARAGWYDKVTVKACLPILTGTMWDRPAPILRQTAALVTVAGSARSASPVPARELVVALRRRLGRARRPWLYVGVTVDEGDSATGLVAILEAAPADAAAAVTQLLADTPLADLGPTALRWRRGGRHQGRSGAIAARVQSLRPQRSVRTST